MIVEKKDKSLRLCQGPLDLNKYVKKEYHRPPSVEEIYSQLNEKKIFTIIDMTDCYWHKKLDKELSLFCTFNTPFGRWKFNRLPFGLKLASDVAQMMVNDNFGDTDGALDVYDDLIIAASDEKEHDQIMHQVLQRTRERSIKFNLKKIRFRVPQVNYLGNVVTSVSFRPDPNNQSSDILQHSQNRPTGDRWLKL